MEHGDNNYMQNTQNLMDNVQIASGGGVGVGCGDVGGFLGVVGASEEIGGSNIGGKFDDEHNDEDELKYIKEVQQSEKQQQQQQSLLAGDADDLLMQGIVGNGESNGNRNGSDEHHQQHDADIVGGYDDDVEDFGNGRDGVGSTRAETIVANAGADGDFGFAVNANADEEEVDIIKNDGDFSTTSNTTSSMAGDDVAVGSDLLQVEMKIEAAPPAQLQHESCGGMLPPEEIEDEEPSSLATNGTSSLSENPPQQQPQDQPSQQQRVDFANYDDVISDKENTNPSAATRETLATVDVDFDHEMHSQLNPDAKEFVPHFGSSTPASPTSPLSVNPFGENVVDFAPFADAHEAGHQSQPNALPRHLLSDECDDFIAQSPQKGRCADMDTISLPPEAEFENEVAKRPHELELDDDLIGDGMQQQRGSQIELNSVNDGGDCLLEANNTREVNDLERQSSGSFVDHGPETCVDMDADIDTQQLLQNDVMKQSIYTENANAEGDGIEHLLNTVQPLPSDTDSLNNSFTEEAQAIEQTREIFCELLTADAGDKELLNVEEKEHFSHSPSTEEMQMNLLNEMQSSAKDIPPIPIDPMDSAANMQESFYIEPASANVTQQEQRLAHESDNSMLLETSNPFDGNATYDTSFENYLTEASTTVLNADVAVAAPIENLLVATETTEFHSSPLSPIEKHLMEDTKEQHLEQLNVQAADVAAMEQQMDQLLVSNDNDDYLLQVEEVAFSATAIETEESAPQTPEVKQLDHEEPNDPDVIIVAEEDGTEHQDDIQIPRQATEIKSQEMELNTFLDVLPAEPSQPTQEELKLEAEPTVDEAVVAVAAEQPAEVAEVAAVAVAAAGVAAAAVVASKAAKKPESVAKKTTPTASKSTTAAAKKPIELKKTTLTSTTAATKTAAPAARPRVAPVKPATGSTAGDKKSTLAAVDKKPAVAARPATATTAARKPLSSTTTAAARPATASARLSSTPATAKPAAARPATTTSARKSAPVGAAPSTAAAAKAPTKPVTLGLATTAAAKPKLTARTVGAAPIRKAAPAPTSSGAIKSPTKAAPTSNGTATKPISSAATKPTTSSSTTTTTKSFTARPAPRSVSTTTTTTTTTRRVTVGTTGSNGTAATKTSTLTARKTTSPLKPTASATAAGKLASPTSATRLKPKTKEATPKAVGSSSARGIKPATPSSLKLKPTQSSQTKANGHPATAAVDSGSERDGIAAELQLNGDAHLGENGTHQADTELVMLLNGGQSDNGLPLPVSEAALIDA